MYPPLPCPPKSAGPRDGPLGPQDEQPPSKQPSVGKQEPSLLDRARNYVVQRIRPALPALAGAAALGAALGAMLVLGAQRLMGGQATGDPRGQAHSPRSVTLGATRDASGTDPLKARLRPTSREVFDRKHEKLLLERHVQEEPGHILLLLGPSNCGKSTLMKWLQDEGPLGDCGVLCDLRFIKANSPEEFVQSVINMGMPKALQNPSTVKSILERAWQEKQEGRPDGTVSYCLRTLLHIAVHYPGVGLAFESAQKLAPPGFDLKAALTGMPAQGSSFAAFVQSYADLWHYLRLPGFPVIVIDEANLMMDWSTGASHKGLQEILNAFVYLTKQTHRCHVILVTSDFGFTTWLSQEIGQQYWRAQTIGEFKDSDARAFFEMRLRQRLQHLATEPVAVDSSMWSLIYDICGGDPYLLDECARAVANQGQPDLFLQATKDQAKLLIEHAVGSRSVPKDLYRAYARVATAMLDSPSCTISWERAKTVLFNDRKAVRVPKGSTRAEAIEGVLKELVRRNLLLLRPFSVWANDDEMTKSEVFGRTGMALFPPGPTMKHVMKELKPELEAAVSKARKGRA